MRTAVIGAGRMGMRHVEVVKSLGLPLVGLCDAKPEALEAAGKAGVPSEALFASFDDLLARGRPECVVISTTAPSHAELTIRSAQSGARAILCEKPMATSLADCDRMLAACEKAGTRLAINHQMRFMEQYTLPKSLADSEQYGGLASVTVVGGNFGIAMNGSHYFEMFRYLTGEAPTQATAWFSPGKLPNPRGPQFEDRAGSVRLETASGKRFFMDVSADQGHGVRVTYACRFGQIMVDELAGIMLTSVRKPEHREMPTTRYGMPWVDETHKITPADAVAPSRAVLSALLEGKNFPTGQDARQAIAALVGCYTSDERNHTPVPLDRDLDQTRTFPWA